MPMRRRKKLIELAESLIRVPTIAGREHLILEQLNEMLQDAGFSVQHQPVSGTGGDNLIASRGEGGPWFVTHVDVYPPYEHPQPFDPQRPDKDVLVGRGAVDTKGQIAALLWTLARTTEPVQAAFVVDEEELGRGSAALQVPDGCQGAVVLEPTNLRLAYAEAGSVGLEVSVQGKAAHGAMPWSGISAVDLAFRQYQRVQEQPFMQRRHPMFPRGGWINLGTIKGGHDTMVVPSHCFLEMEVGFAPGTTSEEVGEQIHEAMTDAESIHMTDIWEPWETSCEEEVGRRMEEAIESATGNRPEHWGMPSWTDGANLVRMGVPTVVFGAGDLAVAHTWREALPISELETMADILTRFIQGWP